MDREGGGSNGGSSFSYYSVLGIRKDASFSDVRSAYRKLALKWHPDRWARNSGAATAEAKRRFQQIQEAYSVLSDEAKRSMYDVGLYNPLEDEDEDFCDFMQEMLSMMNNVKDERMFKEMVGGDGMTTMMGFDISEDPTVTKKARVSQSKGNAAKRSNSRC
ncbi:dnaJ homolog subfamily B member 6 isoform X2 [Quercus lobata]|uniref:dnaJ homolog subfamily B member 6 isoform X2 n=1 Tax=Quercus lobata TaxID=97700 RepID=UPI001248833B|nr:dnaJ homolog subfamily B member 6 isoform X2 [Quercus lobata]